jgi:uncharacterized MAPEG superfamily protein
MKRDAMTTELYWLTLTVLMTSLFWLAYVLDRLAVRGLWATVADSQPESGDPHSLWAQRAMRAHMNAVENLAIFVPGVLVAHVLNIHTPATQTAAAVYFFARLVHFFVYTMGVPLLRTLAFFVGWGAQIVFLATILGLI